MVWPAAEPLLKPSSSPIVESPSPSSSSSSSSPSASYSESLPLHSNSHHHYHHQQQQHHRPPQHQNYPQKSPSPTPTQTTQDWHHHRQRQWLDRIPYDLPPQHSLLLPEPSSSSQSSVPSTARGFVVDMPGSYYSRSNSPSAEEQAMFHLAHDSSPPSSHQPPTNNNSIGLLSPPPSSFSPIQDPFSPIPSAQSHTSSYEQSPPPFTNISPSTQPATPQQEDHTYHRPASPISLADSQPTLCQGRASSEYSSRASPIPRPTVMSHIHSHAYAHGRSGSEYGSGSGSGSGRESGKGSRRYPRTAEETEAQALSAVVEGIGRMQVNMNLDQAGRWRIARRADAPW
ncbi:hypothetical protein M440DRAFT_1202821 [Trichoderma longibrachiatum ATCC 18648]|uniref:Uncharacterized protein n=1 Tax=Trichoderma longibrachiatum ATCC 18648 TaxID=983965 RepID=A0A2T4CBA5_TRILO|nr:hypothetical protein M440DRAFT_1202821 [Trichoderma longibrachiatum ATCC 18648]